MAKKNLYQIYKYELKKIDAPNGMILEDVPLDKAQDKLYELLHGDNPLNICRPGKGDEQVKLDNYVEAKCDGVIVLMICNERAYTVTERKTKKKEYEHPGCYVVIDNRQNVAQLAIERFSAFDNDSDKVCVYLHEALKYALSLYGLGISITAKAQSVEFWQMIDSHTRAGERIKRVSFRFSSPKDTAGIDAPEQLLNKLELIHALQRATGGASGELNLFASEAGGLRMDQTNKDLAEMVCLCHNNAYDLEVDFSDYGLYRSGTEEKALCPMAEDIVTDFIHGITKINEDGKVHYELITWLDKRRITYENYEDRPVKPARKGRA